MRARIIRSGEPARLGDCGSPPAPFHSIAPNLLTAGQVKLEAILFDIDGTLVDSNDIHAQCWLEAFSSSGKSFPYEVVRNELGKGGDLLVPDLLDAREIREIGKRVRQTRDQLFQEKYQKRIEPFPGIREAFEELHGRGVRLALASSGSDEEVEYYTGLIGVGDLLDGTTSKRDAKFSKPSPEIFCAALERVGSRPERTITVGDTPYDILASHRAELAVVAVLCGGFARELLSKAEFLFANVEELVRKIDEVDAYFNE
jgi:HAD superfamily hydrolase (TIGR01509 family)